MYLKMGRDLLKPKRKPQVGFDGGRHDTDFTSYANVFRAAAERLADGGEYGDVGELPIVFLYRHAIELMIKAILMECGSVVGLDPQSVVDMGHSFEKLLRGLEKLAEYWKATLSPGLKELLVVWHDEDHMGWWPVIRTPPDSV